MNCFRCFCFVAGVDDNELRGYPWTFPTGLPHRCPVAYRPVLVTKVVHHHIQGVTSTAAVLHCEEPWPVWTVSCTAAITPLFHQDSRDLLPLLLKTSRSWTVSLGLTSPQPVQGFGTAVSIFPCRIFELSFST